MGCTQSQILSGDENAMEDLFPEQDSSRDNQKVDKFLKTALFKLNRMESCRILLSGTPASRKAFLEFLKLEHYGKDKLAKYEDAIKHLSVLIPAIVEDAHLNNSSAKSHGGHSKPDNKVKVIMNEDVENMRSMQRTSEVMNDLARAVPGFVQSNAFKRWRAFEIGALSSIRASSSILAIMENDSTCFSPPPPPHAVTAAGADAIVEPNVVAENTTAGPEGAAATASVVAGDKKKSLYSWLSPRRVVLEEGSGTPTAAIASNGPPVKPPSFSERAFAIFSLSSPSTQSSFMMSTCWLAYLMGVAECLPISFWLLEVDYGTQGFLSLKTAVSDLTSEEDGGGFQSESGPIIGRQNKGSPVVPRLGLPQQRHQRQNRKLRIVYANEKFEAEIGQSRENLMGTDYSTLLTPESLLHHVGMREQHTLLCQNISMGNCIKNAEFDVLLQRGGHGGADAGKQQQHVRTFVTTKPVVDQYDSYRYMMCLSICSRVHATDELDTNAVHDFETREFQRPILNQLLSILPSTILDTEIHRRPTS